MRKTTNSHHYSNIDRNITKTKTTSVETEIFNKKADYKIVSLI